jgi:thiamine pyrophosphate-dependent acetolactate synthase large subunit-like protein
VPIRADVVATVSPLLATVRERMASDSVARQRAEHRRALHRARRHALEAQWAAARAENWDSRPISRSRLIGELATAFGERRQDVVVARGPLAWPAGTWEFTQPGAYLGYDGGAGIGSGPGMAVGAALALRGSRPVVAILGDGDLLMANTALWTAAHHRIPLLVVVVNNRTYFNDEQHQERVARVRKRPVDNRGVGQRMDDPPVNFAGLARDLGIEGFGPVEDPAELAAVYAQALSALDAGHPALVDVHTAAE